MHITSDAESQTSTTHAPLDFSRPPSEFIDVGHSRLAYRSLGQGPDVVLIHGWPLTSATWRDVAPRLATRFRVHLIDLPGAGHTTTTEQTPYGLAEHARTVRAAIDALGLTAYGLIAHDSGAVITRLVAAADTRAKALVVAGSEIPGYRSPLLVLLFFATGTSLGQRLMTRLLRSPTLRRSLLGFGSCFADVSKIDGEFGRLFAEPLAYDDSWARGQMQLVNHFDWKVVDSLREAHARILAPTLLLWGDNDPYFPLAEARKMIPQFGGPVEVSVIDRARLFPHEEYPELFAGRCLTFLERTLRRAN